MQNHGATARTRHHRVVWGAQQRAPSNSATSKRRSNATSGEFGGVYARNVTAARCGGTGSAQPTAATQPTANGGMLESSTIAGGGGGGICPPH